MTQKSYKPSVAEIYVAAAVIKDQNGRSLLVRKRNTDTFMQAGGKIEASEAPATALVRELREELGIEQNITLLDYAGRITTSAANELGYLVTAEIFNVSIPDIAEIAPAAEIEQLVWYEPGNTTGIKIAPLSQILLARN